MMHFIAPIFFVIVAIGLFFGYIDPTYQQVKDLRAEELRFDDALERSRELEQVRDQLLAKYNSFPSESLERLQKLLPDNVDNVRLILDLDSIASAYGMRVRDVSIDRSGGQQLPQAGASGATLAPYNSFNISFSVAGSYEDFLMFLQDLERSLRLVDVVSVSFENTPTGVYDFHVRLRTYWLE